MTEESTGSGGSFRDRIVDDYSGYKVYDRDGQKLGKVEYTVLDDRDQPEYIGIKTGFFGGKTTLIPEELIRLDQDSKEFSVQSEERKVNAAPTFDDENDVSQDLLNRTLEHYGVGGASQSSETASPDQDESRESTESRHDRDEGERQGERRDYDEGRGRDRGEHSSEHPEDRSGDRSGDRREDRPSDRSEGEGSSGATGAAAGADAGSSSVSRDRDSDRDSGRESESSSRTERRDPDALDRRETGRASGGRDSGDREQVRVTLKREKAHAERVIGEDGQEEVRIRKETVSEEALVDVEETDR